MNTDQLSAKNYMQSSATDIWWFPQWEVQMSVSETQMLQSQTRMSVSNALMSCE
jgi:hypothetical protein